MVLPTSSKKVNSYFTAQSLVTRLMQEGHDVEVNVWNTAMRAAVNANVDTAMLDDLFEDMLLAGKSMRLQRPECSRWHP